MYEIWSNLTPEDFSRFLVYMYLSSRFKIRKLIPINNSFATFPPPPKIDSKCFPSHDLRTSLNWFHPHPGFVMCTWSKQYFQDADQSDAEALVSNRLQRPLRHALRALLLDPLPHSLASSPAQSRPKHRVVSLVAKPCMSVQLGCGMPRCVATCIPFL